MKTTILLALVVAAFGAPQGYDIGAPSGLGLSSGLNGLHATGSVDLNGDAGSNGGVINAVEGVSYGCGEGEILHVDGTCVVPEITRKVYVFDVPAQEVPIGPAPSLPPPAVDHNILFVRLPEEGPGPDPIVIPPPRQNNIVYVLNKQEEQVAKVIEVPAQPQADPEIYFVNYEEGQNPSLPLGVDLETALAAASAAGGQVLGGAGDGFGGATEHAGGEPGFSGAVSIASGAGGFGGFDGVNGGHRPNGLGVVNGAGIGSNGGVVGFGVNGGVAGGRPSGIYSTP